MESPAKVKPGKRIIDWSVALGTLAADSGRCSLIDAIKIVGQAKYGPDWTGQELNAHHWYDPPKDFDPSSLDRLSTQAPPPMTLARYRAGVQPETSRKLTSEERAEAIRRGRAKAAQEQAEFYANLDSVTRVRHSLDWIAQLCRDNKLQGFYRLKDGGPLGQMAPHEWNVDDPLTKLAEKGGFDRWFPTNAGNQRQWFVYVFIDRDGLSKAITALAHAPITVPIADLDRLSPYLRFAVNLALRKGYFSADTDDSRPVREAEVRAAWPDALPDIPISPKAVQMIATLIGFPDVEAIKRSLERAGEKKGGA